MCRFNKMVSQNLLAETEMLKKLELDGDFTARLALTEEYKTYPFGAVWDYYCDMMGVPVREKWLDDVRDYEKKILEERK